MRNGEVEGPARAVRVRAPVGKLRGPPFPEPGRGSARAATRPAKGITSLKDGNHKTGGKHGKGVRVMRLPAYLRGVVGAALVSLLMMFLLSGCGGSTPEAEVKTAVPALGGMGIREAEALLSGEGLSLGSMREEYSDTVPAGLIIRTVPAEGEEVDRGTAVDLVVSGGPEPVTLPDLRGKSEGEAMSILQGLGLQANLQRSYNESVSAGLVCSSDPAPGTSLAKGSVVTLTVSLGSAYVTCPTCRGRGTVTVSETCPECGGSGVCYG